MSEGCERGLQARRGAGSAGKQGRAVIEIQFHCNPCQMSPYMTGVVDSSDTCFLQPNQMVGLLGYGLPTAQTNYCTSSWSRTSHYMCTQLPQIPQLPEIATEFCLVTIYCCLVTRECCPVTRVMLGYHIFCSYQKCLRGKQRVFWLQVVLLWLPDTASQLPVLGYHRILYSNHIEFCLVTKKCVWLPEILHGYHIEFCLINRVLPTYQRILHCYLRVLLNTVLPSYQKVCLVTREFCLVNMSSFAQ